MRSMPVADATSRSVTPDMILQLCAGRPRIFAVDGGRTAESIYHDLGLAASTICQSALVIVDDYFQESWPEVSEGVCRFMLKHRSLLPVAIGGNKLFFTNSRSAVSNYQTGLASAFAGRSRMSVMFGEPVLVIGALTFRRRMARSWAWKALRHTALGRLLRVIWVSRLQS